mgnify:CR=1 FL=1
MKGAVATEESSGVKNNRDLFLVDHLVNIIRKTISPVFNSSNLLPECLDRERKGDKTMCYSIASSRKTPFFLLVSLNGDRFLVLSLGCSATRRENARAKIHRITGVFTLSLVD